MTRIWWPARGWSRCSRWPTRRGWRRLAGEHLSVPGDKGANAGLKVASLVAGMVAGADSIDDMALLRHGGMGRVFARAYAPSTLGSFLRAFTFGHVRQLDAVASRFLTALAAQAPQVVGDGTGGRVLVDVDDTIIEVHGYAKQGAGFGYSKVRGLNALLATVTTAGTAPVVVAQRLRKGSCGSPRGAKRLVADALKTVSTLHGRTQVKPLLRADSAFYGAPTVGAALRGGAEVSVTVRMDPKVKAAIATIDDDAWTPIEYTDAIFDEASGTWVSRAEVAEVPFTAFTSKKATEHVPGRLVVRRIPDLNAEKKKAAGQGTLFDTWRFHAFFTTTDPADLDTVDRGQDPPRARDHRAGPRRPEELRPGAPALGQVHRQRRLAGAGRHRVQPHPHRRHHHRHRPGEGDHRHHPPQADHRPGPGGDLGPAGHLAPADRLALGNRVDPPVHPRLRATDTSHDLTTQPSTARPGHSKWNTLTARSAGQPCPQASTARLERIGSPPGGRRWIEAKSRSMGPTLQCLLQAWSASSPRTT